MVEFSLNKICIALLCYLIHYLCVLIIPNFFPDDISAVYGWKGEVTLYVGIGFFLLAFLAVVMTFIEKGRAEPFNRKLLARVDIVSSIFAMGVLFYLFGVHSVAPLI